jgi:hypothetical protein
MYRAFGIACVVIACSSANRAAAQPKESPGYWKFVELVRVEYPVEKVHKYYPVKYTFEGSTLTAVAKALDGNDPRIVHTEEGQVWSWTPPPQILVPGEKVPMKFELKLERPKFDTVPGIYIGGRMNAGFGPPRPKDAAAYRTGADTRTEKGETGGLDPRDKHQGGLKFAPATYTQESFVVVPGRKNPFNVKEHPDQISFRVGGVVGNTREFNTVYEYKWVDGEAPADRGGPGGETSTGKTPGSSSGGVGAKWEYKVLDIPLRLATGNDLERKLAELGEEGWELTGVFIPPLPPNTSPTDIRFIFKRPKK